MAAHRLRRAGYREARLGAQLQLPRLALGARRAEALARLMRLAALAAHPPEELPDLALDHVGLPGGRQVVLLAKHPLKRLR
eukprot:scaffold42206_cov32-Prasinocladus_malaysianus.AAC.3